MEVGQPNFSTPVHIIESTIAALNQKKTAYIPNAGSTELRQVVSDRYSQRGIQTNPSQIIITSGSMLAMFSLCLALLSPGDECLIPLPGFGNYQQMVSMVKANSVPYLCRPSEGYLPRIEELASLITSRTRCIIICNPGNPTGAVFPPSLLREIIELCQKKGVFVISDGRLLYIMINLFTITHLNYHNYGSLIYHQKFTRTSYLKENMYLLRHSRQINRIVH